jgi:hypothetical protein
MDSFNILLATHWNFSLKSDDLDVFPYKFGKFWATFWMKDPFVYVKIWQNFAWNKSLLRGHSTVARAPS